MSTTIDSFQTPPTVAKHLGVHVDRVRGWIETGQLPAVNLGDKTRPRWRISPEGLEQFLRARSNQAAVDATRRSAKRRAKKSSNVIEFFS
jgi:excisionase family DNA binding protein